MMHVTARSTRLVSLVKVLSSRELKGRYRQSVLELGWSLITPITTLAVYGVVLNQAFDVDAGGAPYLSLVWVGMVVWMTFSSAIGGAVTSIVVNRDLISKVAFPKEVLPLAVVGASVVDLAIGILVLVPLLAVQVGSVSVTALATVPVFALVMLWTAALAVLFLRDAVQATRLALQVGFFATPVMYSSLQFSERLDKLSYFNPLAVSITALRDVLIFERWPEWKLLGSHALAGSAVFVSALYLCRLLEDRMVDVI